MLEQALKLLQNFTDEKDKWNIPFPMGVFGTLRLGCSNNYLMGIKEGAHQKKSRYGASVYLSIGSKLMLRMNYTHDVKIRYGSSTILYNQQSITGGLQCNF